MATTITTSFHTVTSAAAAAWVLVLCVFAVSTVAVLNAAFAGSSDALAFDELLFSAAVVVAELPVSGVRGSPVVVAVTHQDSIEFVTDPGVIVTLLNPASPKYVAPVVVLLLNPEALHAISALQIATLLGPTTVDT